MSCDPVVHSWAFEWQTLIAGGLALLAGIITVVATWVAASRQVVAAHAAADKQVAIVKEQLEDTRKRERRKTAAASYTACQLLSEVAREIESRCTTIESGLQSEWEVPYLKAETQRILAVIMKPSLATVWVSLGLIGREAVSKYLQLDIAVDSLETVWEHGITGTRLGNAVGNIRMIANNVARELASEQKLYLAVLTKDQD